jgi:hypothetical protein
MRLSVAEFFSAGAGGVVEGGLEPDPDEFILNCYRLADRFRQSPDMFLRMPLSEVNVHIHYTIKLIEAQRAAREREDDE